MIWLKRDPLLGWLIGLTVVSLAGGSVWLWHVRTVATHAVLLLEQKNHEREELGARSPAPTEDTEQAIDHDLMVARTKLSGITTVFHDATSTSDGTRAPQPIDAYFEIAGFVEKTRTFATQSHVSVRSDEHFGFASYTGEGPAADTLSGVLRQRVIAETLVGILFAARPTALISVQRERPPGTAASAKTGDPADFFEFPSVLSLRRPGVLEADAFKLEFTGPTRSLRDFLNGLVSAGGVFAVRSVETEPVVAASNNSSSAAKPVGVVPVVVEGPSHFRVVVERLRPVDESPKATL